MKQNALPLEERVANYIKENDMILPGSKLLVAVSGGQDSVCLLHLLAKLKTKLNVDLHVVHLDHKLRGRESAADAQYVIDLCHRFGLPMTVEQRDVRVYRKQHKLTLEEAAREVRYTFFTEVARRIGAKQVAVAHTRDDQVETILMHLIRGTGTKGLTGLQPIVKWKNERRHLKIVRPLLGVSREETGSYCRRHRLEARLDSTNLSLKPLRNRVRLELIPLLKQYNPGIVEALLRTSVIARDDIAFLENYAARRRAKIIRKSGENLILDKARLLKLNVSIRRYVLRNAIEQLLGTLKDIETRHIEEMMNGLDMPAGSRITLPEGLQFVVEYDRYLLGKNVENVNPFSAFKGRYELNTPGTTEIPGWTIEASLLNGKSKESAGDFVAYFDYEKTGKSLFVCNRISGDRFQPLGMQETKKVGEFMIDAHIPRLWRAGIPLVCSENGVLWVVGYRIDEKVKITAETQNVLRLQFIQKQ